MSFSRFGGNTSQLGAVPAVKRQALNATVNSRSRLQTVNQFKGIIIKSEPCGAVIRLSDAAHVELGTEDYSIISKFNGKPAAGLGIKLASGANALADTRYRNGLDSYLESLVSQCTLYSAQQTLITLKLSEAVHRVTLYKVLGGGADATSALAAAYQTPRETAPIMKTAQRKLTAPRSWT